MHISLKQAGKLNIFPCTYVAHLYITDEENKTCSIHTKWTWAILIRHQYLLNLYDFHPYAKQVEWVRVYFYTHQTVFLGAATAVPSHVIQWPEMSSKNSVIRPGPLLIDKRFAHPRSLKEQKEQHRAATSLKVHIEIKQRCTYLGHEVADHGCVFSTLNAHQSRCQTNPTKRKRWPDNHSCIENKPEASPCVLISVCIYGTDNHAIQLHHDKKKKQHWHHSPRPCSSTPRTISIVSYMNAS